MDLLTIADLPGDSVQVINPVITVQKAVYFKNASEEDRATYLGVSGDNTTYLNYFIGQDTVSISHYTGWLGFGVKYDFTIQ